MKVIKEGYNSQQLYVVVTNYSDEYNVNMKHHSMFYKSKEAYEEFKTECKKFEDDFNRKIFYSK